MKRHLYYLFPLALILLLAGVGLAVAAVPGEHEVVASACNTSSTPDQTIRLDTADVATVPGAVATACATATATATDSTVTNNVTTTVPVTQTVTTTQTVTAPASPCNGCYLYAPLDGSIAQPPWLYSVSAPQGGDPASDFSWLSGGGLRYHVPGSATPDVRTSQLISHYLANGSSYAHTKEGESTWYRSRVRFPVGTNFPAGEWDYLVEWHKDSSIIPGADSTAWETFSDGPLDPTVPGINPRFEFEVYGGKSSAPSDAIFKAPAGSIQTGHWYDLVAHIVWGTSSSSGLVEAWIDGQPFPGYTWPQHIPTLLYNSATGVRDDPAYGIYSYHYKTSYPTDRDHDDVLIGPTAASVGVTP